MKRALAILLLLAAAHRTHAQAQHPNWERGIAAEKAYEFGDLDTVNLFNGNLNVSIPIGQTYHLGGNLSYGFVLHYGGNSWEFASVERTVDSEQKHFTWPFPAKRQNAGFGWRLSLGELTQDLPCAAGLAGGWAYVAPDGGTHCFRGTAHPTDVTTTPGVSYSADGSYLRLDTRVADNIRLEFPDGTYHMFDSNGRLKSMNDRFGNFVNITSVNDGPNGTPHWHITDSANRVHDVFFKSTATYGEEGGQDVDHASVSEVRLAVTEGQVASYSFHYESEDNGLWSHIPRHPIDVSGEIDPLMPADTAVALLTRIDMPEGLSWSAQYVRCGSTPEGDCPDSSGSLKSLTLPTGGELSWTYQQFALSGAFTQLHPPKPPEGTLFQTPVAVETRTMKFGNAVLGTREYAQELVGNLGVEHRVVVTDHADTAASPIIRRTRSYFSICAQNCDWGIPAEYGLPLSRRPESNEEAGWYVSSEDLGPDGNTGNWNVVLRRRFVKYEGDVYLPNVLSSINTDYNRRVMGERTRYEDGKLADTEYDHFDGLGHYRTTQTRGTFGRRDERTTFTNFNPAFGDYKARATGYDPYPQFSPLDPWILNTFNYETVTEALPNAGTLPATTVTARTEACFDPSGFLTHRRTFRSNVTPPANPPYLQTDLLAVFTKDARGNIATEQYYGGDIPEFPASTALCTTPPTPAAFSLAHEWASNGALLTSKYKDGSSTVLQILHQEADANTGFITKSIDTADVGTTFGYDQLGRIKTAAPDNSGPSERSATTKYDYSMNPPTVTISQQTTPAPVRPLPVNTLIFDGFGRLLKQQKVMPDESLSIVRTDYNGLGWKTRVSESEAIPANFTTFDYDPLGRPRIVTSPDHSKVVFTYTGASQMTRTVNVRTENGDEDATTTETYDREGKLWKVTEPNNVVTSYSYDIGNRLRSVCMNSFNAEGTSCGQVRTFLYDNRGFLTGETHPEKSTTYADYDARGHALRRVDGATDLKFEYDRAERLRKIYETGTGRPLKELAFGTDNAPADRRNGKLVTAIRHNWVFDGSSSTLFNFQVVESYVYDGRDGRAGKRTTREKTCAVAPGQPCTDLLPGGADLITFETSVAQDPLGAPSTITYPSCTFAPCNSVANAAPTISNRYRRGLLEGVDMPASQHNDIAYWSNGLVKSVGHANGITDLQTGDSSAMRRPAMLSVTGASDAASCTAATIAVQPASTTITSGTTVTLSAQVNGDVDTTSHPFTLQWYVGASPFTGQQIGGATTTVLGPGSVMSSLPVTVSSTTSYWLHASNNCGAADSTTATVTTCNTVAITGQPSPVTVVSGQTATLTVTATGSAPHFQWYQGASGETSVPVSGATANVLSFLPAQNASYWVRVSNDCAAVANSNAVTVTVTPPSAPAGLSATYQPAGGILVTWNAVSTPAGVRNYVLQRWYNRTGYHDYVTLGATTTSFLDADALENHAYMYRVRVVDGNGVSSAASAADVATAMTFTDDTITAGVTVIRGVHFAQMRKAIDALRAEAGQAAAWGPDYPDLTGTVLAAQVNEMRTALAAARSQLGLPPITYPTPVLAAGTPILRSDFVQMRSGVK
ncbi:MAG TPA: hypothetical protein VGR02_18655 [Thermoanaerobaculia bacterium]|nr:hypothetical protein [Thermoanaerobaculia bacterium]